MDLIQFQEAIGYTFVDTKMLKTALTHRSYMGYRKRDKEITEHNERLEFLGDAVLELVVTEFLFTQYKHNEGYMTSLRAALVNYKIMGDIGNQIGMDELILLSPAEKAELGKARLTIVADSLESVIGAIYLDGGYQKTYDFIQKFILSRLPDIIKNESFKDGKTELQEYCQRTFKMPPRYEILSSEGPDHAKTFFVGVFVGDKMISSASGKSKQDAETESAIIALNWLKENPDMQLTTSMDETIPSAPVESVMAAKSVETKLEIASIPRIVIK